MPDVLRFIIFPVFNGQIHELMVTHTPAAPVSPFEIFTVHLRSKNVAHVSFGGKWLVFHSNRPVLKRNGVKLTRRPDYTLVEGKVKYQSNLEVLIRAIDDFVIRNFD